VRALFEQVVEAVVSRDQGKTHELNSKERQRACTAVIRPDFRQQDSTAPGRGSKRGGSQVA